MTVAIELHRTHWTGERIARLGFLLGLGWDVKRVAEDPIIASTQNNVHRQAQRFGLGFRAAAAAIAVQLPPDATQPFRGGRFQAQPHARRDDSQYVKNELKPLILFK